MKRLSPSFLLLAGGLLVACSSKDSDTSTSAAASTTTSSATGTAGSTGAGGDGTTTTGSGDATTSSGAGGDATTTTGTAGSGGAGGSASAATGTGGSGGTSATGTGGSATGGSAGSGGSGGGTTTDAGTLYPSNVCAIDACSACFTAMKCNVADNPCNDDPACNPKQNKWSACVCSANGDATATGTCDSEFTAVNATKAQPIIDCVKQNCPVCYQKGPTMQPAPLACAVAHADCRSCVPYKCADAQAACDANTACKSAGSALGPCLCNAQMGNGTVEACTTAFQTAGGALATAQVTCAKMQCGTACGL